ncbi:MAG TPA: SAM-dependent methyltransferase [Actinomycetes bacterium]|nr:SAM-dependent methyltransferase [Actinomycetes bacterium]
MPENLADALASLRADLVDPDRLVRAVATGRRRGAAPPQDQRLELRPVDIKAGRRLLLTRWDGTQTRTEHVPYGEDAAAAVDAALGQAYGSWHVQTTGETVQLRVTKKGEAQVHRSPATRTQLTEHDRVGRTLLAPDDPLFTAIGAGADKRRQVEAFLRALDPVLDDVPGLPAAGRPLRVVDLGCGNAALTLATYAHLSRNRGWDVHVTGVDAKAQARAHNTEAARRLGWADAAEFVEGRIEDVPLGWPPDVVLALHACDTATDDALARAIGWRAPLVLAAPCCHHDVQRQLTAAGGAAAAPEPYGAIARHAILRERFADVLTDALRAAILRLSGYRVDVVEFVASRHTPRNVLIRAVRTGAAPTPAQVAEYTALTGQWRLRPALEVRLGGVPGAVG